MSRKFKVVDWTASHLWVVEVTGKDGSYTPIMELPRRDGTGEEPTYNNQLHMAARLLEAEGLEALDNPHGMIGRSCGCGSCFTCAAAELVAKAS